MSGKKNHLMSVYVSRLGQTNDIMLRVIITHILTEYIINRIITEKCSDSKKIFDDNRSYSYAVKLTILHCMGIIPDKLYHNLTELNGLRNSFAHNLELHKNRIAFYENMRSEDMHITTKTESNFENGIEWLCDSTIVDFANLAHDLKIDIKYEYK